MISMGDELGRTQRGNNNAYPQDNELSWVDWSAGDDLLLEQVEVLLRLRGAHPALRADRWLLGGAVDSTAIPDVEWRHPSGRAMAGTDWTDPAGHALVAVLYAAGQGKEPADRVTIAFNAGREKLVVCWPDARPGFRWRRALDTTAIPFQADPDPGKPDSVLSPRCVVVLVEETG